MGDSLEQVSIRLDVPQHLYFFPRQDDSGSDPEGHFSEQTGHLQTDTVCYIV